jgi:DNA-binding MarR family transcriptional regulator
MQVATTNGIGYLRHDDAVSRQLTSTFRALFVLSGAKGVSPGVLRKQLGLSDDDFNALLESLHRTYLVDSISELRGDAIVEYYSLTEEGKSTLQQMMERMCELPELD